MPLLARTATGELALPGRGSVMQRCLAAGLPVASSCSGRGACGRCAVAVLEGADALTPPSVRERIVLQRNGQPSGSRLACRCRPAVTHARIVVRAGYW